jgi:gamma-glutamyltranspeptidase/glutathione hydrolase
VQTNTLRPMSYRGVVAAGHPLSAEAGAQVLRDGGNAFDAAVCAVMTSLAVESMLTGLGAGGFLLAHTADGDDHLLDFFVEVGGRGLDPAARGELVAVEVLFDETPQVFNIGPAACGVPGVPAGLSEAAERFCTMPLSELAKPAIRHAREGVRISSMQAYMHRVLEPVLTHYEETRVLYAPQGQLLREGDTFRFPDLADALERFGAEGPGWIYGGRDCERICAWVCERGGALHPDDFAAYRVIERRPVEAAYRGRKVLTNAPPSSGGILIAYALDLLEHSGDPLPLEDADGLSLLAEVMDETQRARGGDFHDRLHEDGFAERFLSGSHLEEARSRIARRIKAHGHYRTPERGDALGSTTHIAVLDADGNAASVTCSNGTGSGVLPPGSGLHLNNMLGEEDLNPLGFHRQEPGMRVTSMMAPTVVLREGEIELALGSAGSNRLRSAIMQVIRYVVDYDFGVRDAVRHGRMHYEGGVLHVEDGFDESALRELERRGYRLLRWKGVNLFFGGAQAVYRDPDTGALSGGGDPRRDGAVVAV